MAIDLNQFYFNPHAVPLFLSAGLMAFLGIRALFARQSRLNRYFAAICVSVIVWLVFTGLAYMVKTNEHLAGMMFQCDWVGVSFISVNVYAFSSCLLGLKRPRSIGFGYFWAAVFAYFILTQNPLMAGIKKYSWGYFPLWDHRWSFAFLGLFFLYMGQSFRDFIACYRKTRDAIKKNQIKYMFLAFFIAYMGSIDYLPTFGFNVYPLGFLAISCFVAITSYAIAKHRLMDITILIRKTLVYSIVMGVLTVTYLFIVAIFAHLFEGLTGYQTVFSSAVAAGLITVCFQPLRKRAQVFVDRKFFRQYVDREEKLYELSREVITHTTPEAMGRALMHVLSDTLHPKGGALFLRSRDGSGFAQVSSLGTSALPERMEEENELARYFKDHPQPFIQDMIDDIGQSLSTRLKEDREDAA